MTTAPDIRISSLFKIFGPNPDAALAEFRNGIGKEKLLKNNGHVLALADINLKINAGRTFVVMGLSGSGKSTLIRHINRLIEPTSGDVEIDGRDILTLDEDALREFRRRQISMVFQRFALLPHRTVEQNVMFPLTVQELDEGDARNRAAQWIERVGLNGYQDRYPAELSGGMQQRVGLARALATNAPILLMDEPFSALDPLIRADMQGMMIELQKELGKTIVFISHDLDEAVKLGDEIAILRDGTVVQQGAPETIIQKPADAYVASFTKGINRARVLTLGAIATTISSDNPSHLRLAADMTLEKALIELTANNAQSATVQNSDRNDIGYVHVKDIVAAMLPK